MAIELDDGTVIKAADHAANIVEGRGSSDYIGMTKVISSRLPINLVAEVQALANKSGKTRNAMISALLEVGIEEVRGRLKTKTLREINSFVNQAILDELAAIEEEKN